MIFFFGRGGATFRGHDGAELSFFRRVDTCEFRTLAPNHPDKEPFFILKGWDLKPDSIGNRTRKFLKKLIKTYSQG